MLHGPKGFDHLLPIVKKLMQEEVKFKVYILGEGEERKALERQQHELRLDTSFCMPGFIANPYSILKNTVVVSVSFYCRRL